MVRHLTNERVSEVQKKVGCRKVGSDVDVTHTCGKEKDQGRVLLM